MQKEDDLILETGETDEPAASELEIIENQVFLVNNILDLDDSMYDELQEQKIKVIERAMKLIMKAQAKLMKDL